MAGGFEKKRHRWKGVFLLQSSMASEVDRRAFFDLGSMRLLCHNG